MNKSIEQKIGITIDLTNGFFCNGMQQNIIFLSNCINQLEGKKCFLLYHGKFIRNNFLKEDLCISYSEYIRNKKIQLDILIYAGFNPGQEIHQNEKQKNKTTKYVSIQYGNELTDDIYFSLSNKDKILFKGIIEPLDQIWTSPHYVKNISYLKTKNRNENIKIIPYIWDDIFIKNQFEELKINKKFEIFKKELNINKVTIFEPNLSFTKSCLIPINIVERFEQLYPKKIQSCNVIASKDLVKNEYFVQLLMNMGIFKERSDFLKCRERMKTLFALRKYGGLVISHQILNELNYLYFETLFLSLPLIHNSPFLADYGYFYEDFEIDQAANLIKDVLDNHKNKIQSYEKKNIELFKKYSPFSDKNKENYKLLLNSV